MPSLPKFPIVFMHVGHLTLFWSLLPLSFLLFVHTSILLNTVTVYLNRSSKAGQWAQGRQKLGLPSLFQLLTQTSQRADLQLST